MNKTCLFYIVVCMSLLNLMSISAKAIRLETKEATRLSLVKDVTLMGVEENATMYIGASMPIWSAVDDGATMKEIEWVLNKLTIIDLNASENSASIMARREGEVNIMARAIDGSDSSRSINLKVRPFNSMTSNFKITKDMVPIKQYGITKRFFQLEVNPNLSSERKIETLKNYLSHIQAYGRMKVTSIYENPFDYVIYSLEVVGYGDIGLEIRVDKRDRVAALDMMNILNQPNQVFPPTNETVIPPEIEEDISKVPESNELNPEGKPILPDLVKPVLPDEDKPSIDDKDEDKPSIGDEGDENSESVEPDIEGGQEDSEKESDKNPSVSENNLSQKIPDSDIGSEKNPYHFEIDATLSPADKVESVQNLLAYLTEHGRVEVVKWIDSDDFVTYQLRVSDFFDRANQANEFYIELIVDINEESSAIPIIEMLNKLNGVERVEVEETSQKYDDSNVKTKSQAILTDSFNYLQALFAICILCGGAFVLMMMKLRK